MIPAAAPPTEVGFLGVWLLGVSVGLTACTAACLPFVGTWVLGRGGATVRGDLASFLSGRLAGYALLGGLAGAAGEWLADGLSGPLGHYAVGAAAIVGGAMLLFGRRSAAGCGLVRRAEAGGPALMGLALSLTPCSPLSALLAAAALAGDPWRGGLFGLAFGLGAAVTPLVLILPVLRLLGRRMGERHAGLGRWLRIGSALVLMAIGVRRLILGFSMG